MLTLILFLLATSPQARDDAEAMLSPPTLNADDAARLAAICDRADPASTDIGDVLAIQEMAERAGAPRDILAAVWCWEAGMRVRKPNGEPIRGDFLEGLGWRAHGPAQLHPWFRHWCGMAPGEADELLPAMRCYLRRMVDMRAKYGERCGEQVSWRVAEAMTANGPRYQPLGCRAESEHWRLMETWR